MNAERKLFTLYAALLLIAGTRVMALELKWNGDVVGTAKALITSSEEKVPVIGESVAQETAATPATTPDVRIEGIPLGTTELEYERANRSNEKVYFRLNNHKDRVIAGFSNCPNLGPDDTSPQCDTKEFRIDGLTIDLRHKTILLGSDVIGKFGGFLKGESFKNGYYLRSEKTRTTVRKDSGGDYEDVERVTVKVYLEKKTAKGTASAAPAQETSVEKWEKDHHCYWNGNEGKVRTR